ncbi:MAG: thioredoxin family protein, partial [Fusobacterium sp.]|nr:thioredoxin family protein [Fusobacterium sp.]
MNKRLLILFFSIFTLFNFNISANTENILKIKEFRVQNLKDNNMVESKDILVKDKINLLVIAAEWCGDCHRELPFIEKIHNEFKDKVNVVVIYSNDRTTKERSAYDYYSNKYT